MDINAVRSAVTVFSLLLFLALVVWAWGRGRRRAFDEAANLPFLDDEAHLNHNDDETRRAM